jgi:hypothetical protein
MTRGPGGGNGGAAGYWRARGGPGGSFIAKLRREEGARAGKASSGSCYGEDKSLESTASGRDTGGGAAVPQAPWRADRAPTGEEMERWPSRGATRGRGRAGGGRR